MLQVPNCMRCKTCGRKNGCNKPVWWFEERRVCAGTTASFYAIDPVAGYLMIPTQVSSLTSGTAAAVLVDWPHTRPPKQLMSNLCVHGLCPGEAALSACSLTTRGCALSQTFH